jgi:hypothetical protein
VAGAPQFAVAHDRRDDRWQGELLIGVVAAPVVLIERPDRHHLREDLGHQFTRGEHAFVPRGVDLPVSHASREVAQAMVGRDRPCPGRSAPCRIEDTRWGETQIMGPDLGVQPGPIGDIGIRVQQDVGVGHSCAHGPEQVLDMAGEESGPPRVQVLRVDRHVGRQVQPAEQPVPDRFRADMQDVVADRLTAQRRVVEEDLVPDMVGVPVNDAADQDQGAAPPLFERSAQYRTYRGRPECYSFPGTEQRKAPGLYGRGL